MTLTAAEVFRDFETDGVPGSGSHRPIKADIRALLGGLETAATRSGSLNRVLVVATTNVSIANGLESGDTIDGTVLVTGKVVLLPAQTDPSENGAYTVPLSGPAARTSGLDTFDDLAGAYFSVMQGVTNGDTLWRCTSDPGGVLETDPLVFEQASFGDTFDTKAAVQASTISTTVNGFRILGYLAAGDGGSAWYKRVGAQPSHNGKIQSADGAWWELDEKSPNELMFGAVAAASNAVRTAAIQSLLTFCGAAAGRKANIVAAHTITSGLTVPADITVEWNQGFASSALGILDKGFNGDMLTLGSGVVLIRPMLRGNGGTWTGRGVVINTGSDQIIYDPFILDMSGYCIEFPTGGAGIRFKCLGGLMYRTNGANAAIGMPASEVTTTGYRHFVNVHGAGQPLIDMKNGGYTEVIGGASGGLNYAGNTTGRTKVIGHRCAANITILGPEHTIEGNSFGGTVTIGAGATYCTFANNIIASDGVVTDSSGNATNFIFDVKPASFTPSWKGNTSDPAIGNGSFAAKCHRKGRSLKIDIRVNIGSTTTVGSGDWYFELPLPTVVADATAVGSIFVFDSGTGIITGTCFIASGTNKIYMYAGSPGSVAGNGFRGGTPVTWANGDYFVLSIEVPLA